ncbi:MAG: Fe-S cluster assembly protein SufD [Gammaproteobacteria bacterium]
MTASTPHESSTEPSGTRQPWQIAAERQSQAGPETGWLSLRRTAALGRLGESGLPNTGEEDWRYTSLAAYTRRWTDYLVAPAPAAAPGHPSPPPGVSAGITVDIVDGVLQVPAGGLPACLPAGLTVRSMNPRGPTGPAEDLLRRLDARPADSLVDLNTALLADVVLVTTAPGAHIAEPVHVRAVSRGGPGFAQPRLLVDLAPGSQLTLILEHSGRGGALVNAVADIWLARDSRLDLVRVQSLPDDGMLTETTRIEVGEAASVAVTSVDLGSQLSRHAITVALAGTGASATLDGLFLADGHRHIDNRTLLEHRAPQTTSRETFRGIADDHGRGIFNGKIIVLPGAPGSNATLTNRNLLLSSTAEIDTKPELEIYVDDVRCSHGATTGQLDAAALFYLRSRGLDPATARQVLTSAFLRQGLESIGVPAFRSRLDAQLQARLAGPAAGGAA